MTTTSKPRKRKLYTRAEKTAIVLEANASSDAVAVAAKYAIPPDYIYKWRRELGLKGVMPKAATPRDVGSPTMATVAEHRGFQSAAASHEEVQRLLAKIGQQSMEIEYLNDQLKRQK